jgi:hypothetical protein
MFERATTERAASTIIGGFALFSLFYYSYVYFYGFDEGISAAPFAVKALKDAAYLAVAAALAVIALRARLLPSNIKTSLAFAPLALALVATSLIHAPQTGLAVQLWQNVKNVVIFIPLFSLPFYLSRQTRDEITFTLFRIILLAALVQCAFVLVFHGSGGRLWLDGIYAGLIGNPNSFALLLNWAAAIILSRLGRLNGRWLMLAFAALAVVAHVMLGTTSGSQIAIFVGIIALSLIFRPRDWKRLGLAVMICVSVAALDNANFQSATFTMQGAGSALAGMNDPASAPSDDTSLSVTNRLKDITDALSVLQSDAATMIFGSFDNASFRPMDGQFWVFLYNSGLLGLLTFAGGAGFVYVRSLGPAWKTQDDDALALHLIIVAFGVTFIASRVLMYFPFNFLFFLVTGLAVSNSMRRADR